MAIDKRTRNGTQRRQVLQRQTWAQGKQSTHFTEPTLTLVTWNLREFTDLTLHDMTTTCHFLNCHFLNCHFSNCNFLNSRRHLRDQGQSRRGASTDEAHGALPARRVATLRLLKLFLKQCLKLLSSPLTFLNLWLWLQYCLNYFLTYYRPPPDIS